jgi:hypothetical protein
MNDSKTCSKCLESKPITCFGSYTDNRSNKQKIVIRHNCKQCRVEIEGQRHKENRDRHNMYNQKYKANNRDKIREYERNRHSKKRIEDPHFRLRTNVGSLIRHSLKDYKDDTCNVLTGCSVKNLKVWIESQFTDEMNWENCKEWHIDHVIPLSFFDLTDKDEQLLACNWTNLRPLFANENLKKSNKILQDVIIGHISIIKKFIALNSGYQTSMKTCWWQRIDLWYGKNPEDIKDFTKFLTRIIRSED